MTGRIKQERNIPNCGRKVWWQRCVRTELQKYTRMWITYLGPGKKFPKNSATDPDPHEWCTQPLHRTSRVPV